MTKYVLWDIGMALTIISIVTSGLMVVFTTSLAWVAFLAVSVAVFLWGTKIREGWDGH